jgi:hypothetical protein
VLKPFADAAEDCRCVAALLAFDHPAADQPFESGVRKLRGIAALDDGPGLDAILLTGFSERASTHARALVFPDEAAVYKHHFRTLAKCNR